ncbi:hypothetical protein FPOAC2_08983 [Fusarium poae]
MGRGRDSQNGCVNPSSCLYFYPQDVLLIARVSITGRSAKPEMGGDPINHMKVADLSRSLAFELSSPVHLNGSGITFLFIQTTWFSVLLTPILPHLKSELRT